MKKTACQIITIIGAIIAVIGIIIDAITYGSSITVFSIVDLSAVAAIVGVAFIFGKNKENAYLGYLITLILGVSSLTTLIFATVSPKISAIGFVVMSVASIVFFFIQFVKLLGFKKDEE